jgi:hypothetical protein
MSEQDVINSWLRRHACPICAVARDGDAGLSRSLCPEAEAMLRSVPAVADVRAAGASMLPGFDSVPSRPDERSRSWSA